MKFVIISLLVVITSCALAQTNEDESTFKSAFLNAVESKDVSKLMTLTCLDGVSPEWKTMLKHSNLALIQQFQLKTPLSISFIPFSEPQPKPIQYKGVTLVPNLPITTIFKIVWAQDQQTTTNPASTDVRIGMKDGKLLIVAWVPQEK